MFNIGDEIVYPMHGAGIIESIEEKKVLKEKRQYYIMKMPIGDMMVMIPVENTDEIGMRHIVDSKTADKVYTLFSADVADINENWNKRYRENMEKLRTGDIFEILDVVKALLLRDKVKGLSTGERKMLNNSRNILISELILSSKKSADEIENMLDNAVDDYYKNKLVQLA